MTEWPIVPDSKSGVRATVPGVQIPLSPWRKFNTQSVLNLLHFFVSNACKIQALRGFDHLPPLRDKSVQHSLKKRNILQK